MSKNTGWIGVDLDGTLAKYQPGQGVQSIGAPVPSMLAHVKFWVADGRDVRIVTARVGACGQTNPDGVCDDEKFAEWQRGMIETWCEEHIGQKLRVTASKDFQMAVLYDDRAVQVQANTGLIMGRVRDTMMFVQFDPPTADPLKDPFAPSSANQAVLDAFTSNAFRAGFNGDHERDPFTDDTPL